MYDIRTARLLGQLLAGRTAGPVFLSTRVVRGGTVDARDTDPASGRRRIHAPCRASSLASVRCARAATGQGCPR